MTARRDPLTATERHVLAHLAATTALPATVALVGGQVGIWPHYFDRADERQALIDLAGRGLLERYTPDDRLGQQRYGDCDRPTSVGRAVAGRLR
jgi:hypothetical protein